jgi:hypothetical protein
MGAHRIKNGYQLEVANSTEKVTKVRAVIAEKNEYHVYAIDERLVRFLQDTPHHLDGCRCCCY